MADKGVREDHLRYGSDVAVSTSAIAGGASGLVARVIAAPLDVVKIRLQLQVSGDKYRGIRQTMKTIVIEEGFLALWKGNVPAALMYMIYGATQFTTYSSFNSILTSFENSYNLPTNSFAHSFILGSLAGCTSTLVSYPFDLLRTRFASRKEFSKISDTVRDMYKQEGVLSLFKGVNAAMISISFYTGSLFWAYEVSRAAAARINMGDRVVEPVCGFVAGVVSKGLIFPLDLIRRRLQVNTERSKGILETGWKVAKFEGIRGLYKGFFVSVLKSAPTTAVSIWTYEAVVRLLE